MLQKLSTFAGVAGPVVTIVMDGYGLPKTDVGSAIAAATAPTSSSGGILSSRLDM